jgi:hypothetical protein
MENPHPNQQARGRVMDAISITLFILFVFFPKTIGRNIAVVMNAFDKTRTPSTTMEE